MSHTSCILYLVQFLLLYVLDCENSHLSLLLANRDISQGRTSAVSDRNTILIMESMLNIINAVVMESQVQICSMSCFSWSIMVNLSSKLKQFRQKRIYSMKIDCFVVDLLHLHLTYVTVCLLYIVHKQQLKQYNYYIDQSELMTRFWTDFRSPVWNFCS